MYLATSGSDLLTRLQTVRVVSVLWLLLTVVGAWLLAGEVRADGGGCSWWPARWPA